MGGEVEQGQFVFKVFLREGHATKLNSSHCTFALSHFVTGALSCGRFQLCLWWWMKKKASFVLSGPQACLELRIVSQWRVGGQLNVRHTWPLPQLNAGLCLSVVLVPLQLWASLSLSLQRLSLCQKYVPSGLAPHLWISCLQRQENSALYTAKLCAAALYTVQHLSKPKPFNCAKEESTLAVPSVDNCMLLITCCHSVCSHRHGCSSAVAVAPYPVSQFTNFLAICSSHCHWNMPHMAN